MTENSKNRASYIHYLVILIKTKLSKSIIISEEIQSEFISLLYIYVKTSTKIFYLKFNNNVIIIITNIYVFDFTTLLKF